MDSARDPRVVSLEERIRLLEAENDLLNERAEDVLLLGLVAENITHLKDRESIIDTLLERVSILYEIPYCGFARIDLPTPKILNEFAPNIDKVSHSFLRLNSTAVEELKQGALSCSDYENEVCGVDLRIEGMQTNQALLIPCGCRSGGEGVFIFAHESTDPDQLVRKLIVLQQVIGLASARIDNLHLLEELKRFNLELENRVAERTVELHRAALALEKEVAERKRAEEVVAAERQRLRAVVEHLPEGVIVLDGFHKVILANKAAAKSESLIGSLELGARIGAVGDHPLEDFESASGDPVWREFVTPGEPEIVFEVATRRLGTHQQGAVIVLRDITEQRAVAEQLLQQERIAAMGHLAAGIAHDFNNLIQAVTILAEGLLLDTSDDPVGRKVKTREILAQSERAASLIRQILDYSRQTVTRPEVVDLRAFLNETLTMLERLIPETVRFSLEAKEGEHAVRIDPVQLQQVLTNLTLNSSQAMSEGGEIRVRLQRLDGRAAHGLPMPELAGNQWISLSIGDTGCGIPDEVKPRIFEPFYTTKEPGRGTGLGLAQTYGIVLQNGGHIDFESTVGAGTTFSIFLPADPERARSRPSQIASTAMPTGKGETVLVVEDDLAVRELLHDFLKTLGYRPVCAANGADAMEIIDQRSDEIGLVLTDVVMPKMGGLELLAALKERGSTAKVILMSGYDPEFGGPSHRKDNVVGWLQKPFSVNTLATTLAEVVRSVAD